MCPIAEPRIVITHHVQCLQKATIKGHTSFCHWYSVLQSVSVGSDIVLDGLATRLVRQPFWHLTTLRLWRLMAGMNNAKFALLIAQPHKDDKWFVVSDSWKTFLTNLPQNIPPIVKTERIAENVWLIHLESELTVLSKLIDTLQSYAIPIRILFLEDVQGWIKYPPDAEANPSQTTP